MHGPSFLARYHWEVLCENHQRITELVKQLHIATHLGQAFFNRGFQDLLSRHHLFQVRAVDMQDRILLLVVRANSMEEAMQMINDHEYGNGTCIFTRDGEAARYFSDNILVGMVGINVPLPVPVSYHSFGGWKRSLFGCLSAYGPDGVRFYTNRKTITQRWPSRGVREGAQFSFPSN